MAAPATVLKTCNALVHNGVERVKCGKQYKGTECPNKSNHLMKIKTGYCNMGQCEGTKPKGNKDKPLPTCSAFTLCACKCHAEIDEMFKITEMERIEVVNPEYIPERVEFNIFDYLKTPEDEVPFSDVRVNGDGRLEQPVAATTAPAVAPLTTRRTDTGRAARGGLEAQVLEQCQVFAAGNIEATPKMIAEIIADKYKIPTPSTGAIGAVFNRWESLGFAKQARKPVRFTGFTGDGTWVELSQLKARTKRAKKQSLSAARRGYR